MSSFPRSASAGQPRSRGISFVAPDIAAAVTEIRNHLGSEAIILDIRRHPARGLGRLWHRPQVEVIACLPDRSEDFPAAEFTATDAPASVPPPSGGPRPVGAVPQREAAQRYARAARSEGMVRSAEAVADAPRSAGPSSTDSWLDAPAPTAGRGEEDRPLSGWRVRAVLDRVGLLPLHAESVVAEMQTIHGPGRPAPETLAQELVLARAALIKLWRPAPAPPAAGGAAPLHVFLGVPGCGKSTVLCKWLAQTVLVEAAPARVWRLDGRTTNPSELVGLYGDILGVRVERAWNGRPDPGVAGFVDLGGADFRDQAALDSVAETVARLAGATVHLVLNAAYTVPLLLAQIRAFSALPLDDLILTHLDEEPAWGKLWNLALGTNCPLGRLSAGQNIPGWFSAARPELLGASLFGG